MRLNKDGMKLDIEDKQEAKREKWFGRLKSGLTKSRQNLVSKVTGIFSRFSPGSEEFWEDLESALIQADVGVKATTLIIDDLRDKAEQERIQEPEDLISLLKEEILKMFGDQETNINWKSGILNIFLVVGVNGTGKTTTLAKLGNQAKTEGKKVLFVAADTFRAAAIEQLEIWGQRLGIELIKHKRGSDPAAVVYDAIQAAKARSIDLLLIDTAGRLHTYTNLMEELKKIKRVIQKEAIDAEVKTILVIDATTGQNALFQARMFNEALDLDALILTKLDGTAKGGIVVAISEEIGIPIVKIGVGEQAEDFQDFKPNQFAEALLSME